MQDLRGMIPGMNAGVLKNAQVDETALGRVPRRSSSP